MSRTFRRIIILGLVFILIAMGAAALVVQTWNSPAKANPLEGFTNGVANTLIDVTGVKGRIDSELREKAGAMAAEMGVSQSAVNDIIDMLAVEEWRAASLPKDAEVVDSSTVKAKDVSATITTYDDPSYVTIGAFGISVTMQAPESAQPFTPYIHYLGNLE